MNSPALPAAEGSLADGERVSEDSKKCENGLSLTVVIFTVGLCLHRWLENNNKRESEDTNKIPSRPQARRVERVRRNRLQRPGTYIGREIMNRFMTSRRVRAEQNQSNAPFVAPVYEEEREETMGSSRAMSILREILMKNIPGRNQERNNVASVGVEDRDSVSSIIGVMNSESQIDILRPLRLILW
ncbi:hypothetical protein Bca52824_003433 [Brassica carinata]|uniref:Uncharacterized protein n=1 Tax=Brassica carinata TaxID=52824 RepID=A0A8X7WJX6_BRACI|nr:hypothetical protein Bca52824_003433 [Brassica carinata]